MIEIPDKVTSVGEDAFAYCNQLTTVIIGRGVKSLSKGTFYNSQVKDVYVKALTPPSVGSYLLSSNPTIHVYASAVAAYKASEWNNYGTIVGDLTDEIIDGLKDPKDFNDQKDSKDFVFDLTGRRVTKMKPGTIYIRNGKKYLVK